LPSQLRLARMIAPTAVGQVTSLKNASLTF